MAFTPEHDATLQKIRESGILRQIQHIQDFVLGNETPIRLCELGVIRNPNALVKLFEHLKEVSSKEYALSKGNLFFEGVNGDSVLIYTPNIDYNTYAFYHTCDHRFAMSILKTNGEFDINSFGSTLYQAENRDLVIRDATVIGVDSVITVIPNFIGIVEVGGSNMSSVFLPPRSQILAEN